jgi:hypothetical protein
MKIGLIDVDSKIPNLALMKLSAYYQSKGHIVKWWNAFESFDKIFASKIFKESKTPYLPKGTIKGGSGWNLKTKLDSEIEHIYPDYSLYNIQYAMGYITRGCMNRCPFCIVPEKEGYIYRNAQLEEFWAWQTHLVLLDNALTDYIHADEVLQQIIDNKIHLDLQQGFNIRTIKPKIAQLLTQIKLWKGKQWHIAWDNIKEEKTVMAGIQILNDAGIRNYKLMCYILVNYNSTLEEDLYRIKILDDLDIDPFVMIYNRPAAEKIYKKLGRWCNRPQLRKTIEFNNFFAQG